MDEFDTGTPSPALLSPQTHVFKGKTLGPYSFARRMISRQVLKRDLNPADEVWTLAIIYVLILDDAQAQAALYDVVKFKRDLFVWIETLNQEDYIAALDIADQMLKEAKQAEVRTVADASAGGELKKKA